MASYFTRSQARIKLPVGLLPPKVKEGLRRGQLGAIHAISAHFAFQQEQAAIIVMPTGSGKTGVLMLAPFILGSQRALVITSSRLVRHQITLGIRTLDLLRTTKTIPRSFPNPRVIEVKKQQRTPELWQELLDADYVIAHPSSISPGHNNIIDPPSDLFDLILVDEAHHLPADTWTAVVKAFPKAKIILFTATPFRRDEKEIDGKFVFVYPLQEAFDEDIFSEILFLPVIIDLSGVPKDRHEELNDRAIARKAEEVFRKDRADGFQHAMMVRTDQRNRAEVLERIYAEETSLKLKAIFSGISDSDIEQAVADLRSGDLDGIICVDMLGEGFDLPKLKIAAIHTPHKSLSATLQFIGRFARRSAENLGAAKFLAVPNDINEQSIELYEESATWQQIVPSLLEGSINREQRTKQVLGSFRQWRRSSLDDAIEQVSTYSLRPYFHVRVYESKGTIDLDANLFFDARTSVEWRWTDTVSNTAIFITKQEIRPLWITINAFNEYHHDLFIVHASLDGRFVFVCSSNRDVDEPYTKTIQSIAPGAQIVSEDRARKAHLGLRDLTQSMLGLRRSSPGAGGLKYETRTGLTVNNSIDEVDGQNNSLGHSFGVGLDNGVKINIGLTGSGKIWSNTSDRIPDFLDWCDSLAERLASDEQVVTGSELDLIPTGRVITELPEGVIATAWDEEAYAGYASICFDTLSGAARRSLSEVDIHIDHDSSDCKVIHLCLEADSLRLPIEFRLVPDNWFSLPSGNPNNVMVRRGAQDQPIEEYLNDHPLRFYFWNRAYLSGCVYFQAPGNKWEVFPKDEIEGLDCVKLGVSINLERGTGVDGLLSGHEYLEQRLVSEGNAVIFCDHSTGEIADYIAIKEDDDLIRVRFYHCKSAKKGDKKGARVTDLYDVCGQANKSVEWAKDFERLRKQMLYRLGVPLDGGLDRFVVGNTDELDRLAALARRRAMLFRVAIFQPALSKASVSQEVLQLLGATDSHLKRFGCDRLLVICSD